MQTNYCDAACQKKHWPKHKKTCKLQAAELRDEALFKDPPPKEECLICFLPIPAHLISCISLPPATVPSVPIYDFVEANEELKDKDTERYYPCCGKGICRGCSYSTVMSGNDDECPFCNSDCNKTEEERVQEMMRRVEANDAASICQLVGSYNQGSNGVQQDHAKAMELYVRVADLGCSKAHNDLGVIYDGAGNLEKAKFHVEAAAMAGHEMARCNLGSMECNSGNMERAIKHWMIAASAGDYRAMHEMRICFEQGLVSRESIYSTLEAYNNSCAEMRSVARDARIHAMIETI